MDYLKEVLLPPRSSSAGFFALFALVLLLTAIGSYILYLDLSGALPEGKHNEL
jgi:hypothetical protein